MDIQLMIERIYSFLGELGLFGLFIAIFLEGAAVPFPGIVFGLAYGGLLNLSPVGMAGIAAVMATIYSLSSLIPYFIGKKLEHLLSPRIRKALDKASRIFKRYGIWSIALSRPFGIGNYISFISGISQVGLVKYLALTYAGILPWSFGVLYLGDYLDGNYDRFLVLFDEYKVEFYGTGLLLAILFTAYSVWKHRKNEST
ncbi:MAG TPA: VTT domain-containing protein [Planococcus sp. (in: firmicutes)]|nr:VTT domain-containing protein [Planococcus sp. (in: firmicutes)]